MYFSPQTRNYYAEEFIRFLSRGILILLMQKHLEFQIVTPRTLSEFKGTTLVLPDVRLVNESESASIRKFVDSGKTLIITGEDATHFGSSKNIVRFPQCPGKEFYGQLQKETKESTVDREQDFLASLNSSNPIRVTASGLVATSIANVNGAPHVFFANFEGLRGKENPIQAPQDGVQVTVSGLRHGHGFFLPFLGEMQQLEGTVNDAGISYALPTIEKGAVFWYEP